MNNTLKKRTPLETAVRELLLAWDRNDPDFVQKMNLLRAALAEHQTQ